MHIPGREALIMTGKPLLRYMQMVSACVRALECSDQQLKMLLEGTDIKPAQLAQPYSTLGRHQETLFYQNLLKVFPEPGIGLRLGETIQLQELGPIGYASLSSTRILEAIEVSRQFNDLLIPYLRWDLVITKTEIIHRLSNRSRLADDLRIFLLELLLSSLKFAGQHHFGPGCIPNRVTLAYPDPGYRSRYERCFERSVLFNQAANELRYSRDFLEIYLRRPDSLTHESMKTLCKDLVSQLEIKSDVVQDVISVISASGEHVPTQKEVAARLLISSRSLRRRLQERNRSYRSIVDEVRLKRAREGLLDKNQSVQAVAELCGFSELRGFYSAFQRWTGCSPAAWRRKHVK